MTEGPYLQWTKTAPAGAHVLAELDDKGQMLFHCWADTEPEPDPELITADLITGNLLYDVESATFTLQDADLEPTSPLPPPDPDLLNGYLTAGDLEWDVKRAAWVLENVRLMPDIAAPNGILISGQVIYDATVDKWGIENGQVQPWPAADRSEP